MLVDVLLLIIGFIFLIKGADILVEGSSSIAKKFGLSSFFIGLTVVAFGTSTPELVVSILASMQHSAGIALGNIIGSNISNSLLILGASAMFAPLLVKKTTITKEIPFLLLSILAVAILVNDFLIDGVEPNGLTRIDGLILILFFSIFIFYTFGISREKENIFQKTVGNIKEEIPVLKTFHSVVLITLGLIGLTVGGRWIVNSAISISSELGLSEALIGLTIVALGTSLPELAASIVAAKKGNTDIAVGNVVGSNIFNLLWVLGLSSVVSPINFATRLNVDFIMLFVTTMILTLFIFIGKKNILDKFEGVNLLICYFLYMVFIVMRG
ncbi:sodium:proton exchanger [Candidatus Parcubacteria bacterium]|nr:MAG: sodium:proton exchanger [Candidatus Parcubacteria bacterium]